MQALVYFYDVNRKLTKVCLLLFKCVNVYFSIVKFTSTKVDFIKNYCKLMLFTKLLVKIIRNVKIKVRT